MDTEISQVIRDAVVAVGAAGTAIAAWRGIHAWRQQLVGKERHRVAAELLKAAIKWREAVRLVRAPMMFAHEMEPLPEEQERSLPDAADNYKNATRGYTRRWKRVQEARALLEASVIDGEIYLGAWAREWFSDLLTAEIKLRHAVEDFLRAQMRPERIPSRETKRVAERDAILYGGGSSDEFGKIINETVENLRVLVKKHVS